MKIQTIIISTALFMSPLLSQAIANSESSASAKNVYLILDGNESGQKINVELTVCSGETVKYEIGTRRIEARVEKTDKGIYKAYVFYGRITPVERVSKEGKTFISNQSEGVVNNVILRPDKRIVLVKSEAISVGLLIKEED